MVSDITFQGVSDVLVDALAAVEEGEVHLHSTIVGDLGAESIDFLDIIFRLEKRFGIEIPRIDLFPEDILTAPENKDEGLINAAGMAALKERMPFADFSSFERRPLAANFAYVLTVRDLCAIIERRQSADAMA